MPDLQAPQLRARPGGAGLWKIQVRLRVCGLCCGDLLWGSEGRCKPWAKCSQAGFRTMFPGNKTHDAVCDRGLPPAEPHHCWLTIILLAVAACVLVLSVAQLVLHIWQLRRQRVGPPETQLLLEAPPPAEDACSCPFPEEERGERLSEDKGRLGDLWV